MTTPKNLIQDHISEGNTDITTKHNNNTTHNTTTTTTQHTTTTKWTHLMAATGRFWAVYWGVSGGGL